MTIDSANTQPIVDARYTRGLERDVANFAYPATLPSKIKRIIAVKLHELYQTYHAAKQKSAYWNGHQAPISTRALVPDNERPVALIKLGKRHQKLTQELDEIDKAVKQAGYELDLYTPGRVIVYRKRPESEIAAERQANVAFRTQTDADYKRAIDELKVSIREIANAEIAKVKKSLPKELVQRFEHITMTRLLGPAPETEPTENEKVRTAIDTIELVTDAPAEETIDIDTAQQGARKITTRKTGSTRKAKR
jgi:hypothetical protein